MIGQTKAQNTKKKKREKGLEVPSSIRKIGRRGASNKNGRGAPLLLLLIPATSNRERERMREREVGVDGHGGDR